MDFLGVPLPKTSGELPGTKCAREDANRFMVRHRVPSETPTVRGQLSMGKSKSLKL